jgi:hypothetical protein
MRNILLTIVGAVSLTILGMPSFATGRARFQHDEKMAMMQDCPMKLPGAELSVADVENGIVLTITTKSGEVAELRRRIEKMAKMHNAPSSNAKDSAMLPFPVMYEEIPSGARLTLVPRDVSQLEAFRASVRQHTEQMKKGDCTMMQGMMNKDSSTKPTTKQKLEEEDHSKHHPPGENK